MYKSSKKATPHSYTNEIQILHFSDMHFGKNNIGKPIDNNSTPDGYQDLGDLIIKDLTGDFREKYRELSEISSDGIPPLILALSGDFTEKATQKEFEESLFFLEKLGKAELLDREIGKGDIFIIPGNHDVIYDKATPKERFREYLSFYNEFYKDNRDKIELDEVLKLTQIHQLHKGDSKIIIAEINCCMYVEKDTIDQSRGQVSIEAIEKLDRELTALKGKPEFNDYIKIAIIHHHVILLPSHIEPGRGVDSVENARYLLEILSKFDFHLILHGHKHYPQIFSYDPLPLWVKNENKIPQLVISGGSCGSRELPTGKSACNTYSLITIKWHPDASQVRVKIITRGLNRMGETYEMPQYKWTWSTINVSDRILTPNKIVPNNGESKSLELGDDKLRTKQYQNLRGQMPVVEVMPSLKMDQAYEARVWIVSHGEQLSSEMELLNVEWSAGPMFPNVILCQMEDNPNFCGSFHYWGAMLIEAKLSFRDGHIAYGYVYARIPQSELQ